jgi:NitT/TauT family transport system substrate-binding protein
MIEEHPDTVQAVVNAVLRSWEYAKDHPDEVADALLKSVPEALLGERDTIIEQTQAAVLLFESEVTEEHCVGWQDAEQFQITQDAFADTDAVANPVDDVSVYFTNEFVPCA